MSDVSIPVPSSEAALSPAAADAAAAPRATATVCLTCGEPGARRYCASCGQRVMAGRFTMRRITVDAAGDVLDLDHGLLFTIVEMSRRPGAAIREYVSGRTVRYTSPAKYFLLMAALTTLLYVNTGVADAMGAAWLGELDATNPALNVTHARIVEFMGTWMNLIMAAGLPFSAAATWLFFRRAGYNLAEHLIFNTFLYGHVCLLFVAFCIPVLAGVGVSAIFTAYTVASLGYSGWASVAFFGGTPWRTAVRAVVANVLGYLAYMIFIFIAGAMVGIAIAIAHRSGG